LLQKHVAPRHKVGSPNDQLSPPLQKKADTKEEEAGTHRDRKNLILLIERKKKSINEIEGLKQMRVRLLEEKAQKTAQNNTNASLKEEQTTASTEDQSGSQILYQSLTAGGLQQLNQLEESKEEKHTDGEKESGHETCQNVESGTVIMYQTMRRGAEQLKVE